MEESKTNKSSAPGKKVLNPFALKKLKKRSLVERELETNLTARITSPVTNEGVSMSRYGRPRQLKTKNNDGVSIATLKSPRSENTPVKVSPDIKGIPKHQLKNETPKKALTSTLDSIDNIYHENKTLSRFTKDEIEKASSVKKSPKLYISKDLIQNRDDDDDGIVLIKDLFSSPKPGTRALIHNSSKKYLSNQNGHNDNKSVVKTLDFDGSKKRKDNKVLKVTVKDESFDLDAISPYQVGDLAWARMGTFPFWPCIITREPSTDLYVKKKLFGRVEHFILHVTFFADNGRRSWVVDNMLRKYMGLEEFICTREKFTPEDKKKDSRLYAAFFISEKKQSLWNASVAEAEIISRAPRKLRIDVFNDMIYRNRASKKQRGSKITRTDSDVSLSESLYDSLFSDDDNKTDDANRSKTKAKNIKIDVSDVVTACLDNMAAKTGNIKIQRQSHMDRWLQKAKSKTPEKVKTEKGLSIAPVITQEEQMNNEVSPDNISAVDIELKPKLENSTSKMYIRSSKKKKLTHKDVKITKVYKLRRSYEAQSALSLEQSEREILTIEDEFNCKVTDKSLGMDISNKEDLSNKLDFTECNGLIPKSEPLEDGNPHDSKDLNAETELFNIETVTDISMMSDDKNISEDTKGSVPDQKCVKITEQTNQNNDESNSTKADEILQEVKMKDESHAILCSDQKLVGTICFTKETNNEPLAMEVDECMEICAVSDKTISLSNGSQESMVTDNETLVNNCQEISQNVVKPPETDNNNQVQTLMPLHQDSPDKTKRDDQVDKCILTQEEVNIPSITMNEDNKLTMQVEIEMDSNEKNPMIRSCENENQNIDISYSVDIVNMTNTNETNLLSEGVSQTQTQEAKQSDNHTNENHSVTNHSPLKGNEMVLIPELDIENSDSNSNKQEYNIQDMSDVQDHNSNIKSSIVAKQIEPKLQGEPLISEPNAKHVSSIHETNEDINMNDNVTCDFLNESGQSESILQPFLLDDMPNAKEMTENEIEPVEDTLAQKEESNSFFDDSTHVVQADRDSVNNFFRDVNKSEPPDLKSDNLLAKDELLKKFVEPTIEFCEDDDSSDDEPSPEYEPLGDEIAEDFRQHMKCIQSIITDKNDEAQLVKVCNEMAVIEGSKCETADSILKLKENEITQTVVNCNMVETQQKIDEIKTSKRNGVVSQPKYLNVSLTTTQCLSKEIKSELINLPLDESVKHKSVNSGDNLKSSPGKKYSLSLKKNKSVTADTDTNKSTVLNERYKTIDEIEEIIQKNIEPTLLPIENCVVNIAILNKAAYTPKREHSDTPDLPSGDDDFNIDDVSVSSEDSDISIPNTQQIIPRRNLRSRPEKKGGLENPDFLKYLELNQDSWMEQHPDLSHDDIVCYLYKIFLYQENLKSDDKITDEAEPSSLVKGVKQEFPDVQQTRTSKKSKKYAQPKNAIENLFREKYKNAKKIDLDRSDVSMLDSNDDCKLKREIAAASPVDSGIGNSKDSNESNTFTKRKARKRSLVQRSVTPEITKEVRDELIYEVDTQETEKPSTSSLKTPKSKKNISISPRVIEKTGDRRIPVVVISPLKKEPGTKRDNDTESESVDSDSELSLRQLRSKVLHVSNLNAPKKEISRKNVKVEETSATSEKESLVKQKTNKVDKNQENTLQKEISQQNVKVEEKSATSEKESLVKPKTKKVNKSLENTLQKEISLQNAKVEETTSAFSEKESLVKQKSKKVDKNLENTLQKEISQENVKVEEKSANSEKESLVKPKTKKVDKSLENTSKKEISQQNAKVKETTSAISEKESLVKQKSKKVDKNLENTLQKEISQENLKVEEKSSNSEKVSLVKPKTKKVDKSLENTSQKEISQQNAKVKETTSAISEKESLVKQKSKKVDKNLENTLQKEISQENLKVEEQSANSEKESLVKPKTKKVDKSLENTSQKEISQQNAKVKETTSAISEKESLVKQKSKKVDKNLENTLRKEISPKNETVEETTSSTSENELVKPKTKKVDKNLENTYQDPEFLKYFELRQDALIDENPRLSSNEIQAYLYKSWLYENNSKSEIQMNEEIELSNLVKGVSQDPVPQRKARRKMKAEKTVQDEDDVIPKQKPRRKTIKHYFNEDYMSDIEDELEVFEIFKTAEAPITVVSKADDKYSPKKDITSHDKLVKSEDENDEKVTEVISTEDEIEHYYKQLITPKPSVFKGLIREKVCGICEDISNLVKCKGCNEMFHYDCVVTKEMESPKTVLKKKRGRKSKTVLDSENKEQKARDENSEERCQDLSEENISMEDESANTDSTKIRKKRTGRKPKSLQDYELGDEKFHDLSEEYVCVEDASCTFNAAVIEAQLEAKMKELLDNQELNYDSYSSDDGIEWTDSVPGQCEIIDVKLKKRIPPIDCANFKCHNCKKYDVPICFVCKSAVSKTGVKYRQKCYISHCYSFYHLECLDHWPQTHFKAGELTGKKQQSEAFTCPRHVCHTCVCDDPRGCKTRFIGDKLAKCVRCPATYHTFNRCLPAGTQILTASLIICPRHYEHRPGKINCHVNTGWCFLCALGGSLICCEYCPTSFHAECLNIKPPEGNYMCEDCETGRLPLYGEMVWVKLGQYRWWPGIILHPSEIPDNIMAVSHGLGEFVVRFFGQYDHYWVNRGRVFPYQEGDSGRISGQKSKIDADFTIAMEHAQRGAKILKNAPPDYDEEAEIAASLLPPHYIKLKSNKPIGSLCGRKMEDPSLSLTQCECNPADFEPCGPNSQCLNRMLLTECGPTCRAGDRCCNRAFEKRQYPKLTPYRASHRGWGLKTLEDIKAGQFVIEYVGELIDEDEFRRRMTRKHEIRDENFYFLTLDKERMIDAGPKGNLARFMNHCCEPNCETQKWTVLGDIRVGLFAIDDIPANSEVTFNYNLECTGIEKKRCLCGAKRCSGYIGAKPKQIDESQKKLKNGVAKRTYKKRKNLEESPSTSKSKAKKPVGRPPKPKELTEIERDLLIIKTASGDESRSSIEDKPRKKKESPSGSSNSSVIEPTKPLKKKLDLNLKEESPMLNDTKVLKKKSAIKDEDLSLNGSESKNKKKLDLNSKQEDSISIGDDTNNLKKETDSNDDSISKETKPNKTLQKKLNSSLKEEVPISNGPNTLKRKEGVTNGEPRSLKRKLDSNSKTEVSISNEHSSKRRKCIEVGD